MPSQLSPHATSQEGETNEGVRDPVLGGDGLIEAGKLIVTCNHTDDAVLEALQGVFLGLDAVRLRLRQS